MKRRSEVAPGRRVLSTSKIAAIFPAGTAANPASSAGDGGGAAPVTLLAPPSRRRAPAPADVIPGVDDHRESADHREDHRAVDAEPPEPPERSAGEQGDGGRPLSGR